MAAAGSGGGDVPAVFAGELGHVPTLCYRMFTASVENLVEKNGA